MRGNEGSVGKRGRGSTNSNVTSQPQPANPPNPAPIPYFALLLFPPLPYPYTPLPSFTLQRCKLRVDELNVHHAHTPGLPKSTLSRPRLTLAKSQVLLVSERRSRCSNKSTTPKTLSRLPSAPCQVDPKERPLSSVVTVDSL